tara:strand:- start:1088 stop:1585 length:498 start_codon:yes stop_codon:yes gene_type:complete
MINNNKSFNKLFYIVGSRARIKFKNDLCELFKKIKSETLQNIISFDVVKNDYDYLYIGNPIDIINEYKQYIINIKIDLITLKINNIKYDVFVSNNNDKYYYFLYLILGKIPTIVLRQKAKRHGLKLNRHGLYYIDNLRKVPLRFDDKKNMFDNIYIIMNYIYKQS